MLFAALAAQGQGWPQWGGSPRHDGSTAAVARKLDVIEAKVVVDPFADAAEAVSGGSLLAHYPVPLVDGDDLIVLRKSGSFTTLRTRETMAWNVVDLRRVNGQLVTQWTYASDWKPVPYGSPSWEPVYHPIVSGDFVFAPAAGGSIDKLRRSDGVRVTRFNPFGAGVDASVFMAGPPVADGSGNIYYNAIQLAASLPWSSEPLGAWLVRIGADGAMSKATFASLTPNAPAALAQCTGTFDNNQLPWPPAPDAVPPSIRCGAQRPGINVVPAIAPDGTVYTISRAHLNSRWAYLVAANADLTPKWATSLRNRFHDGCDVLIPRSGTPGGCRAGATAGVDPADNQAGSGGVVDNATSSPAVTPDGHVLYGSYTRYNYSQGHLMMFDAAGAYVTSYPWGWDLTPSIYAHDGTYSVVLKENHYFSGSYCGDSEFCPADRSVITPDDPEAYFITQLNASLQPEWKFRNTTTEACERRPDDTLDCAEEQPDGFEWCVNAVAIDGRGTVFANSEDGNLYAIAQGGLLAGRIFLKVALGAAYTPTSIGPDGRVYTQNDGVIFVIDQFAKRRAAAPHK
jgi:hypothetical protein